MPNECPDCNTLLRGRTCRACGWTAAPETDTPPVEKTAWHYDRVLKACVPSQEPHVCVTYDCVWYEGEGEPVRSIEQSQAELKALWPRIGQRLPRTAGRLWDETDEEREQRRQLDAELRRKAER